MLIYSFGSGFNMESTDPAYISSIREVVRYARNLGIEVGGYDLIAWTRRVRPEWLAVNEQTNSSRPSACLASGWYDELLNRWLENNNIR